MICQFISEFMKTNNMRQKIIMTKYANNKRSAGMKYINAIDIDSLTVKWNYRRLQIKWSLGLG